MESEWNGAQEQKDLSRTSREGSKCHDGAVPLSAFGRATRHGGAKPCGATTSSSVTLGRGIGLLVSRNAPTFAFPGAGAESTRRVVQRWCEWVGRESGPAWGIATRRWTMEAHFKWGARSAIRRATLVASFHCAGPRARRARGQTRPGEIGMGTCLLEGRVKRARGSPSSGRV